MNLPMHRSGGRNDPRLMTPVYMWRAVLAADRYRCVWCGARSDLQVDHIRPRASGGTTAPRNLMTLCRGDNRVKSNYWEDPDGYVHYRPWPGADDRRLARRILSREKLLRLSPARTARLYRELRRAR